MENKVKAHLMTLFVIIIWGMSYLCIKVVVDEINPVVSAFYRFAVASVLLLIVLKIKNPGEKLYKEDSLKMILGGLFGVALYFIFENYSVMLTTASNVAILISTIPVFTLISQRIFYNEKMTKFKVTGALLSSLGIIIIIASHNKVTFFSKGMWGDLMALGAALCWVAYNAVSTNFKGNYKSITVTTYQTLWGCIFLSPSLLLTKINIPSQKTIINILFLAIISSCLGIALYIYCLEQLGATIVTTYINLQPVVSLISAYYILKEQVTMWMIIGSIVIISGVILVSFGDKFNMERFREIAG